MVCEHATISFKSCRCSCKWRCKCLIPRKKKRKPPFNSSVPLGKNIGLHPKMYASSQMAPPVGSFNPSLAKNKSHGISWKREEDMEYFSKTMGGRFLESYTVQREIMRTGRGPGTHEIPTWPKNILEKPCSSIKNNIGFGTVPRLASTKKSTTPGPGYTGIEHNPYYYIDKNRLKSPSDLPSFEYDGLHPRFRKWITSTVPCNRYDVRHLKSLDTFLKKVTSKRGPYDLFTGPRDNSTLCGYLALPLKIDFQDWPKVFPGEIEKLMHKSNHFKGQWTNGPRFPKKPTARSMLKDLSLCYKDLDQPGPAHYNPHLKFSKTRITKNYPFDSKVELDRPPGSRAANPGPGRYKIRNLKSVRGHGWTWVFQSKVRRSDWLVTEDPYAAF